MINLLKTKRSNMPKRTAKKQANEDKRVFFGVVLIFVGALLLARNLGLIPDELANLWPVILVFFGLLGLSNAMR